MIEIGPARELLAAVIEQAVWDRRLAVTRGLVDDKARPVLNKKDKLGVSYGLHYFFEQGGLETIVEFAEFELNVEVIKKRSKERYEDE